MSTTPPNQLATTGPAAGLGFVEVATQTFEGIERLANLMAKMGTMPAHLQGKPADCFRIVVQAAKWRMDPFAVAECTSLVHGRMCFEGKLVAAVLQSLGALEGRLDYEIQGSGQNASITVTGTLKGSRKPQVLKGSVKEWRTNGNGSPWDKQPEIQLVYRGTRQWARLYAPEALLGVYTPDEFDAEPQDVTDRARVVPADPEDARTAAPAGEQSQPTAPAAQPPSDPPAPPQHPAIAASLKLWADLQTIEKGLGAKVLGRISMLNGAKAAKDITPDRMDQFGKDVAAISALLPDRDKIDQKLSEWEDDAKKGDN
ncbi:MAG: hypothetical protein RLZZ127_35 [Planctomycetota bacterium]|jgi:hypothetical protein